MQNVHIHGGMIERIRALLTVIEEGSVNRAAVRLRLSQSALSRQMQTLENEIGGRLLERGPGGVSPTGLGHALVKSMRPVVTAHDTALAALRRMARGERSELRVGYLMSAASAVLSPALARLRKSHPGVILILHDLSPREQLDALRAGELDVALTGQEGLAAAREFHSAKLGSLSTCIAVSSSDPLARRKRIALTDLQARDFIGVDETEMPGRNRWAAALCRAAGFKPRFTVIVDGLTSVLSRVVSESAVTLLPNYFAAGSHPGISFVPVSDRHARWDFIVLWQKGRASTAAAALLEALRQVAGLLR